MWRRNFVLWTIAMMLIPLRWGWTDTDSKLSPSTQALSGLTVEPVKKGNLSVVLTAPGKVEVDPTLMGRVMSKVAGKTAKVMVEVGDIVKAGEKLAVIDSREVGEARALYRQAKAKLQLALADLERLKQPGSLALVKQADLKVELERKILTQLKSPDSQVDVIQAQTKLALAKANLERLKQPASQASIAQAEARMKLAKVGLERKKKLFAEKIAAKKELESAETEYKNAMMEYEYQKLLRQGQLQSAQAEVKSDEAELKYQQLHLQQKIKEAEFALEKAKADYEYQKLLHQKEVQDADAQLASAKIDAEFAEERLKLLGVNPSDKGPSSLLAIHTLLSGTVIKRRINGDELVKEGEELFEVMNLSSVQVWAEVYEDKLPSIHPKEKALVSFDAYPGETFQGEVDYIAPQISPDTRTASVRITLKNPDGKLKPGMFAHVKIITEMRSNALTVPEAALLEENGRRLVFVKTSKGEFVKRMIEIGVAYDGRVEVLKGLKEGELVVTKGAYQLKNISAMEMEVKQR